MGGRDVDAFAEIEVAGQKEPWRDIAAVWWGLYGSSRTEIFHHIYQYPLDPFGNSINRLVMTNIVIGNGYF